nr:hypothetical protein [Polaromonas sp. AER18D-145]
MLKPRDQERFAAHLAGCPVCRLRLDEISALRQSLGALPSPALGLNLGARLEDRLRAGSVRRRPQPFWSNWVPAGLAAARRPQAWCACSIRCRPVDCAPLLNSAAYRKECNEPHRMEMATGRVAVAESRHHRYCCLQPIAAVPAACEHHANAACEFAGLPSTEQ